MIKRIRNHLPIAIILLALLALPSFSAATEVVANPSSVALQVGSTTTISYVLDEVPGGLVGYRMHISLTNPACARVTAVGYPSWAILNATQGVPGSEVVLSGVDFGKAIGIGASSVPVATLTLQGIGAGTCMVVMSESQFDDDKGDIVIVEPVQVPVTVSASTSSGTSSSGEGGTSSGGGSGSSSTGTIVTRDTPVITVTSTPTSTATMAVVAYAAPWGSGEVPVSEATAIPADTKIPALQGSESIPNQEQVFRGLGTGIPGSALLIGAAFLILAGFAAFMFMKKKH